MGAAGQLQDVQGIIQISVGNRDHPVADFPDGINDVGARDIIVQHHHHGGLLDVQPPVGFRIIQFSHHHPVPPVMQIQGLLKFQNQDHIWNTVLFQFFDERHRHRIKMGQNHMTCRGFWNGSGCPGFVLCLQPGGVKKLNKGERQHHQQKNDPAEQHHN